MRDERGQRLVLFLDGQRPESTSQVQRGKEQAGGRAGARRQAVDGLHGQRDGAVLNLQLGVEVAVVDAKSNRAILLGDEHDTRTPGGVGLADDATGLHLFNVLFDKGTTLFSKTRRRVSVRSGAGLKRQLYFHQVGFRRVFRVSGEGGDVLSDQLSHAGTLLLREAFIGVEVDAINELAELRRQGSVMVGGAVILEGVRIEGAAHIVLRVEERDGRAVGNYLPATAAVDQLDFDEPVLDGSGSRDDVRRLV